MYLCARLLFYIRVPVLVNRVNVRVSVLMSRVSVYIRVPVTVGRICVQFCVHVPCQCLLSMDIRVSVFMSRVSIYCLCVSEYLCSCPVSVSTVNGCPSICTRVMPFRARLWSERGVVGRVVAR